LKDLLLLFTIDAVAIGIGLFPDVGGSHFLPHLNPKNIGFHLALTGTFQFSFLMARKVNNVFV